MNVRNLTGPNLCSLHCLYNPLSPALFVIRACCNPSHSAMHSRAVLSVVSEKTFLHLPFCPNLSGGTWPSGQPERHNRNAQVCGEAGHVTRHNRHNRHNGIKSKPNVAPPIVQPATMSPPPSNFHRTGSICHWQLAHLLLSHSSPVLACSTSNARFSPRLAGSHQGELTSQSCWLTL